MVDHVIQLKGSYPLPGTLNGSSRPNILQFKEQNFIESLLSGLKTGPGRDALQDKLVDTQNDNLLRLYQPVHRLFNVLLLDVYCSQYGEPRLDPKKIHSSGYVLRKIDEEDILKEYGWMKQGGRLVGWKHIEPVSSSRKKSKINYDVDPALREVRQLGSNKLALEKLPAAISPYQEYEEDHTSLFLTATDIMKNAGKTYLYGVLNLASSEWPEEETDDVSTSTPFSHSDIKTRLPLLLMEGDDARFKTPDLSLNQKISKTDQDTLPFEVLTKTLSYLANEVGLFTGGEEVEDLKNILKNILVTITGTGYSHINNYYLFLLSAYEVFYGFPDNPDSDTEALTNTYTPTSWPSISNSDELSIIEAIYSAMQTRWSNLQPSTSRFEDNSKYRVYAFIRVQGKEGCPLKTIWSEASEDFEIVPWYETSDMVPPTQIELPDVNMDTLSKLKPNVAFKVPESIQKFMDKINLKKLMDGEEIKGSDLGFGMICGFSIPLITICAFIVLQIFLGLLNLVFWWLPFIKICIPFPKPK